MQVIISYRNYYDYLMNVTLLSAVNIKHFTFYKDF